MARRIANNVSHTPTATADTTNLVDSTYPLALQGGSSTQRTKIKEIYVSGQAGSSSPTLLVLARDSQVATGSLTSDSTLTDASLDPATAALAAAVAVFNKAATNKPQRSSTLHLHDLGLNAWGGIAKWQDLDNEGPSLLGNTASFGEMSISAFTGGTPGLLQCHCVYETL